MSKNPKCPECGEDVCFPSVSLKGKDPIMWCTDMGHWAGRLSECVTEPSKAELIAHHTEGLRQGVEHAEALADIANDMRIEDEDLEWVDVQNEIKTAADELKFLANPANW